MSVKKKKKGNSKQCRSWRDGLLQAVSSGSTLFAKVSVLDYRAERNIRQWTTPLNLKYSKAIYPKYSDSHAKANSVDHDQTAQRAV